LDPVLIRSVQSSQLGEGQGYLMQFESPYEPGRTGMAFAARDSENLHRMSEALLKSEVQAQTEGALTMLDVLTLEDKPIVKSFKPEITFTTGKSGKKSFWESYFYTHQYIYYGLVILLTTGFAITLFVVLLRYRKKRVMGRKV
jgi:cellulose synthase operon protein B